MLSEDLLDGLLDSACRSGAGSGNLRRLMIPGFVSFFRNGLDRMQLMAPDRSAAADRGRENLDFEVAAACRDGAEVEGGPSYIG